MYGSSLCWLLLLLPSSLAYSLPAGHPHTCITELGLKDIYLLETLPGQGWDNLQNEDRNMVIDHQYNECRTTADQKFLIPDSLAVYPTKTSQLHTFSEVMEHWDNFTSSTASSINAEVGLKIPGIVKISGKFSSEYAKIKKKQFFGKTISLRSQARYSKYKTKIESVNTLTDSFKKRVNKIGQHLLHNRTDLATYESQILVREYGTHVVTGVELGAMIVQVDYLDSTFLMLSSVDKQEIINGAEAKFNIITTGKIGIETSTTDMEESIKAYNNYVQAGDILALGGIEYTSTEGFKTGWIESINNNQVPIDKEGDPIYHFINEYTLPDMPSTAVFQTYDANVDDGTCRAPTESFVFGGVFQHCTMLAMRDGCEGEHLCDSATTRNPLTGDFSCEETYEPILLNKGSLFGSCVVTKESRCGILWHKTCYEKETYSTYASYSAYWCAAKNSTNPKSGMLFGGTFTPQYENPITRAISCPEPFYALKVAQLSVCVSTDFEFGSKSSVPFAGFRSCSSENPYTADERYCPTSYSQHLAAVVDECQIDVCVKIGALAITELPHIQMPPFIKRPVKASASGVQENFAFNSQTDEWESEADLLRQGSTTQATKGNNNATNRLSPCVVSIFLLLISFSLGSVNSLM
ncbi:MPEG1-like protein [Mya arenaria]|uniref:MPEG1-like protein n=2 Tax=Mya arenaria TaxID=6604 RepID=A0ABY7EPB2_MYAAR|nr:macrophage-expressed gene 1 protein-like isoform X1 [Mya arenaria]WAR10234.1 MPEG1-like protein [Mya arenaria]